MGVLVLALVLRVGWGTFRLVRAPDPSFLEFPDERQYWLMADSLRDGEGLKDELGFRATRMPLYPAALSLLTGMKNGVITAKAVQWVIGAVAAALTAALAAALFDHRVGLLAGLLVAFDPFLVFFSSLLLTETLFVAALLGVWWAIQPCMWDTPSIASTSVRSPEKTDWKVGPTTSRWVVVGLVGALCVYARESGAGLVAAALGFVVACRRFDRRALIGSAIAGGIVVMALLPWAFRNQRAMGDWCWLTTRAGISLYDGIGPHATGASDLGDIKQMSAVGNLSEVEWNRYFLSESYKAIKVDPGRIIMLAGRKLARLWNPFPNVETYQSRLVRAVSAGWMLPILAFGAVGALLLAIRNGRHALRIALFLLLPAVYLSVLHSLFVGSVRYRLGAMPMIEILAAFAVMATVDRIMNYTVRITKRPDVASVL